MVFSVTSVSPVTGNVQEVFSKRESIRGQERIGIWETAGTRHEDRKTGGVIEEGNKVDTDVSKQINSTTLKQDLTDGNKPKVQYPFTEEGMLAREPGTSVSQPLEKTTVPGAAAYLMQSSLAANFEIYFKLTLELQRSER
uniref:Uncharacterized protein n=1 Tax=Molossus molossus TaxID=27622 RepID=A0A7J8GLL3_MOLMO|nr:hypothetical protein HJG59_011487 [Molossus molossus]